VISTGKESSTTNEYFAAKYDNTSTSVATSHLWVTQMYNFLVLDKAYNVIQFPNCYLVTFLLLQVLLCFPHWYQSHCLKDSHSFKIFSNSSLKYDGFKFDRPLCLLPKLLCSQSFHIFIANVDHQYWADTQ